MIAEAVLLCAVVFGPLAFGATETWSVAVLEAMLFGLAIFSARIPRRTDPVRTFLMPAFGVIALIGVVQFAHPRAISEPASMLPFTADRQATGRAVILWCSYAALLYGATGVFQSRRAVRRFLWTLFLLGFLISVIGLMQRGQGNSAYYGLRAIRHGNPFGPYTNYDHAASMLVLSAFAGGGLWLSRFEAMTRIEHLDKRLEAWFLQAFIAFLLAIIAYAIVFIRSRGAIHAMVFSTSLAGAAAIHRFAGRRFRVAAGIALLLSVACYSAVMVRSRVMIGFEEPGRSSALYRLALFENCGRIVKDFPSFGTGLASFESVFPRYQERAFLGAHIDHAHNDWLELFVETGAAGFIVYALAVFAVFQRAAARWFAARTFEARCLGGTALAAVLSFCLHGLVDFSFHIPANAVLFLALFACAASLDERTSGRDGCDMKAAI